jgi:hypothetical protein
MRGVYNYMHRIGFRRALPVVALLALSACTIKPAAVQPAEAEENAKSLFCAFGSVGGLVPIQRPPGFESEFAVAVVEINSLRKTTHVAVSDFVLFDQAGKATKLKRVVNVEVFDEPRVATEGLFAYYLNTTSASATHPWDGTLPAGRIRLRVRVALVEFPVAPVRFKLTIERYVIEGPVDGSWPT